MSLLEEIIAAGKETISDIKNIPGQVFRGVSKVGQFTEEKIVQPAINTIKAPVKSILEEVESGRQKQTAIIDDYRKHKQEFPSSFDAGDVAKKVINKLDSYDKAVINGFSDAWNGMSLGLEGSIMDGLELIARNPEKAALFTNPVVAPVLSQFLSLVRSDDKKETPAQKKLISIIEQGKIGTKEDIIRIGEEKQKRGTTGLIDSFSQGDLGGVIENITGAITSIGLLYLIGRATGPSNLIGRATGPSNLIGRATGPSIMTGVSISSTGGSLSMEGEIDASNKIKEKEINSLVVDYDKQKIAFDNEQERVKKMSEDLKKEIDSFGGAIPQSEFKRLKKQETELNALIDSLNLRGTQLNDMLGVIKKSSEDKGVRVTDTDYRQKGVAYTAGALSGYLDKIVPGKVGELTDDLLKVGLNKSTVTVIKDKLSGIIGRMKSSNVEFLMEIIQQGIEDLGRYLGGITVDSTWKDYAEVGLLGKAGGKVAEIPENIQKGRIKTAFEEGYLTEEEIVDSGIKVTEKMRQKHKENYEATQQNIKDNIENFATDLKNQGKEAELNDLINELPERYKEVATSIANTEPGVVTKKQSNLLNQKVLTKDTSSLIDTTAKIFENKGYTVEKKISGKKYKGSISQYLFVSKNGSKPITIRVSDHVLPKTYVDEYGEPDFSIDINASQKVPFDKITEKLAGKDIAPEKQNFYVSERMKQFEEIKDTLSDAQVVQFAQGNAQDQTLNIAIQEEIDKRGIADQVEALGDVVVDIPKLPKKQVAKSILEEVETESVAPTPIAEPATVQQPKMSIAEEVESETPDILDTNPYTGSPLQKESSNLSYQKRTYNFEEKSGFKANITNAALGLAMGVGAALAAPIPFIGPAIALTLGTTSLWSIGSIVMPKTFDTLFLKRRVLNAFRDSSGLSANQVIQNLIADKTKRPIEFIEKFLGKDYFTNNFTPEVQQEIDKGYSALYNILPDLLKKPAKNTLDGSDLNAEQRHALSINFKALLNYYKLDNVVFDYKLILSIQKRAAIHHINTYYPQEVKELFEKNEININLEDGSLPSIIAEATDFGFEELVNAGSLKEIDKSDHYQRYLILRDTYKYGLKRDITELNQYESVQQYLEAKKAELKIASNKDKAGIEADIKRLETSLLKEKGEDFLDPYRIKDPLLQFLDYAVEYSETIYRAEAMDVLTAINEIAPFDVGTDPHLFGINLKGIMTTMIDDMFFPSRAQLPSYVEIKRANKLYGFEYADYKNEAFSQKSQEATNKLADQKYEKTLKNEKIKGLAVDLLSAGWRGGYWGIASARQLFQGASSILSAHPIGLLRSAWRIASDGFFKKTDSLSVFFMKNGLSARNTFGKSMIASQAQKIIQYNKEMSRFGLSKAFNNIVDLGDLYAQTMFGAAAEVSISEHVIMNEVYWYVKAKTGKEYNFIEKGVRIPQLDTDAIINDFENSDKITDAERSKKIAEWRTISQTVFDGITQTASGVKFLRSPFLKFFNRFTASASSQGIMRLADARTLITDSFKEAFEQKDVRAAWTLIQSSKNKQSKQSIMKMMEMILGTAIVLQIAQAILNNGLGDDEEDKEKRKYNDAASYFLTQRILGTSLHQLIMGALSGILSTPLSWYQKIIYYTDDLITGALSGNKSQTKIALSNLIKSFGLISTLVDAFSVGGVSMTAYNNVKEEQNTNWGDWAKNNIFRFYLTDTEEQKAADISSKDFDYFNSAGMGYIMSLTKNILDMSFDYQQKGVQNLVIKYLPGFLAESIVSKDTRESLEDFRKAQEEKLKNFEDVRLIYDVAETSDGRDFQEMFVNMVTALNHSNAPTDDETFTFIRAFEKKLSTFNKSNRKLGWMLDTDYSSFSVSNSEYDNGPELFKKIQKDPIVLAHFVSAVQTFAETMDDEQSRKKLKQVFAGDIPLNSGVLDALSYKNKTALYANAWVDSLNIKLREVNGEEGLNNGTQEEITSKLSALEKHLKMAGINSDTSESAIRGVQMLFGDKYETQILDLEDRGLFKPQDYQNIAQSLMVLIDSRGDIKREEVEDLSPAFDMLKVAAPKNVDLKKTEVKEKDNIYGSIIPNYGMIIDAPGIQWPNGVCLLTQPNAPVASPYSGVVVDASYIHGLGNQVKVQDASGRVMQYSNLDGYNVAPGDFIQAGFQFGVSRQNGLQCTLFNEKGLIESVEKTAGYLYKKVTLNKRSTPIVEAPPVQNRGVITTPLNSQEPEKWVLGVTPIDKIIESILKDVYATGKIDFSKIKPKIKSGAKTSQLVKKIPSPKSILEEIMQNS